MKYDSSAQLQKRKTTEKTIELLPFCPKDFTPEILDAYKDSKKIPKSKLLNI